MKQSNQSWSIFDKNASLINIFHELLLTGVKGSGKEGLGNAAAHEKLSINSRSVKSTLVKVRIARKLFL